MRVFLLAGLILLMSTFVYADAVITLDSITKSNDKEVEITYTIDVDGWVKQYIGKFNIFDFPNMTTLQIIQKIKNKLKKQAEHRIGIAFKEKKSDDLIVALQQYIGNQFTQPNATFNIDLDGDDIADETWTVHSDGTFTTAPYTP